MRGFTIRQVGIGDGIQFTSLPENYFRATGKKLVDMSRPWYLDYNPFVDRESMVEKPVELWNYGPQLYKWPKVRDSVYTSNAEIHASLFDVEHPHLRRPRLYRFEEFDFAKREMILFQTEGKSHGTLPDRVLDHVIKKYKKSGRLYHIGNPLSPTLGLTHIDTPTLWDLARVISMASMVIGPDSGPSWIAACYPDVVVKKVRTTFQFGYCEPKDWVPLDVKNSHSFWDDQGLFSIYNTTEDDVGFTHSYKRL